MAIDKTTIDSKELFIYNLSNGILSFDINGTTSTIKIVTLENTPGINSQPFPASRRRRGGAPHHGIREQERIPSVSRGQER